MKNLTINNQFLSTSEFLIPSSTGEYLPTNITVIYDATDAEEISEELYDNLPDMIQNLAALKDIDNSIELNDIISLIKEIDKFSKESLSSMILF